MEMYTLDRKNDLNKLPHGCLLAQKGTSSHSASKLLIHRHSKDNIITKKVSESNEKREQIGSL